MPQPLMNPDSRDPGMPADEAGIVRFEQPGIRGFLHRPKGAATRGLVLTHGAGGNCRSPLLIAAAARFSEEGLPVLRCDLPFRQRRATGPPSPATAAADRDGLRQAVAAVRGLVPRRGSFSAVSPMAGGRRRSLPPTSPRRRRRCCCFPIRCTRPASPSGGAPSISRGCAGRRCSSTAPATRSARSTSCAGAGADPGADRADPGRRRRPRFEARALRSRAGERGAAAAGAP